MMLRKMEFQIVQCVQKLVVQIKIEFTKKMKWMQTTQQLGVKVEQRIFLIV